MPHQAVHSKYLDKYSAVVHLQFTPLISPSLKYECLNSFLHFQFVLLSSCHYPKWATYSVTSVEWHRHSICLSFGVKGIICKSQRSKCEDLVSKEPEEGSMSYCALFHCSHSCPSSHISTFTLSLPCTSHCYTALMAFDRYLCPIITVPNIPSLPHSCTSFILTSFQYDLG